MPKRGSKRNSEEAQLTSDAHTAKSPANASTTTNTATAASTAAVDDNNDSEMIKLQMQLWLDEFDLEVKSRIRAMRSQAEDEALVLRRELDVQIMRYPMRVRQLTVREFERDHNGDVLLASARKVDPTPSYSVLATPRGSVQNVAATPLTVRSQQKRNELTAVAAAKRTVPSAAQVVAAIAANSNPSKDSTREQIRLLQEQLNGLMSVLQSPGGK